jgi:hypothetical protein
MPTAAKLVAAALFALTGFIAAETYRAALPEGGTMGQFALVVALIGLICGWMVSGAYAGRGYVFSVTIGVRTSVTIAVAALLAGAVYQMVKNAFRRLYDTPMEAIVGIFEEMLKLGRLVLTQDVLIVLGVGAVVGGIGAEWASRRWR